MYTPTTCFFSLSNIYWVSRPWMRKDPPWSPSRGDPAQLAVLSTDAESGWWFSYG